MFYGLLIAQFFLSNSNYFLDILVQYTPKLTQKALRKIILYNVFVGRAALSCFSHEAKRSSFRNVPLRRAAAIISHTREWRKRHAKLVARAGGGRRRDCAP